MISVVIHSKSDGLRSIPSHTHGSDVRVSWVIRQVRKLQFWVKMHGQWGVWVRNKIRTWRIFWLPWFPRSWFCISHITYDKKKQKFIFWEFLLAGTILFECRYWGKMCFELIHRICSAKCFTCVNIVEKKLEKKDKEEKDNNIERKTEEDFTLCPIKASWYEN